MFQFHFNFSIGLFFYNYSSTRPFRPLFKKKKKKPSKTQHSQNSCRTFRNRYLGEIAIIVKYKSWSVHVVMLVKFTLSKEICKSLIWKQVRIVWLDSLLLILALKTLRKPKRWHKNSETCQFCTKNFQINLSSHKTSEKSIERILWYSLYKFLNFCIKNISFIPLWVKLELPLNKQQFMDKLNEQI